MALYKDEVVVSLSAARSHILDRPFATRIFFFLVFCLKKENELKYQIVRLCVHI